VTKFSTTEERLEVLKEKIQLEDLEIIYIKRSEKINARGGIFSGRVKTHTGLEPSTPRFLLEK